MSSNPNNFVAWWSKIYKGKTLEQIALIDFPYLVWSYENIKKLSESYIRRIDEIRYILNNFVPQVNCRLCGERASLISLLYYERWNVTSDFYCNRKDCLIKDFSNRVLLKLKFDTTLCIDRDPECAPRSFFDDLHRVLRESAGWSYGEITPLTAWQFIDDLEKKLFGKKQDPQLRLFKDA